MTAASDEPKMWPLEALLSAIEWPGDISRLAEAKPHMVENLSQQDILLTIENLGLRASVVENARADRICASDCPCLFVTDSDALSAILDVRNDDLLVATTADASTWKQADRDHGTLIRIDMSPAPPDRETGLRGIVQPFRGTLFLLIGISFFTSLLGFAAPLLVMVVYDRLIPTGDLTFLLALAAAMGVVLATDVALRAIRGRALAFMGARIERKVGLSVFRKLATLPVDRMQDISVEQQIGRLKQFEGLRAVFTGPLLTTLIEMPFILMFFAAIWILDPSIGLLILGLTAIFAVAAFVTVPIQTRLNQRAMAEREGLTSLMLEAARQQRALERLGMGDVWTTRCDAALERSASAARGARLVQHLSQVLGQTLMLAAGIGGVYLGTGSALAGEISFGALIAIIALSWKVLAPIQMLYTSAYQIAGHTRSARQVNAFLGLAEERRLGPSRSSHRMFRGALRLEGVGHRYTPMSDPALSGVSVSIEAGELVVVCGRNGIGKSTLLKLLGGLHSPSNGAISIDGIDYRQIAVDELRDSIGYVPQITEFFHGSVEQNFRLVAAGATEAEIMEALERMSLSQTVANLPEGLQTRLTEEIRRGLPSGTLQAMSVARGLLRDRPLYLLDEPCAGLDASHEDALWAHLEALRSQSTVVMVSDRPSHFALADRLIFLDRGRVVVNDTGAEALRKVRALYASMRRN